MTNLELVESYQEQVEAKYIKINLVEDYDVPPDDLYIDGNFNPYFEVDNNETDVPIEINFYVNTIADITDDKVWLDNIDVEFQRTVVHEMTHLQQYRDGTFIFDWKGAYEDNPNEVQAYAAEAEVKGLLL